MDMFDELLDMAQEGGFPREDAKSLLRLAGWDVNEQTMEVAEAVAARRHLDAEPEAHICLVFRGGNEVLLTVRESLGRYAKRCVMAGEGFELLTHTFAPGAVEYCELTTGYPE